MRYSRETKGSISLQPQVMVMTANADSFKMWLVKFLNLITFHFHIDFKKLKETELRWKVLKPQFYNEFHGGQLHFIGWSLPIHVHVDCFFVQPNVLYFLEKQSEQVEPMIHPCQHHWLAMTGSRYLQKFITAQSNNSMLLETLCPPPSVSFSWTVQTLKQPFLKKVTQCFL